ncbi:hypothetical protein CBL_01338 [Carabus blaptoides fortunei]
MKGIGEDISIAEWPGKLQQSKMRRMMSRNVGEFEHLTHVWHGIRCGTVEMVRDDVVSVVGRELPAPLTPFLIPGFPKERVAVTSADRGSHPDGERCSRLSVKHERCHIAAWLQPCDALYAHKC